MLPAQAKVGQYRVKWGTSSAIEDAASRDWHIQRRSVGSWPQEAAKPSARSCSTCRVATAGRTRTPGRVLRNRHTERWLGREDELEAAAEQIGQDYAAARE